MNRWILSFVLGISFAACSKESVEENSETTKDITSEIVTRLEAAPGGLCVDNNYKLYGGANGSNYYFCDSPKSDCARIAPCGSTPGNKRNPDKIRNLLLKFIDSQENGKLEEFFARDDWNELFPQLAANKVLLEQLKDGSVMIRPFKGRSGKTIMTTVSGDSRTELVNGLALEIKFL